MNNQKKEELRNLARELADCADVMPTSLKQHQDRVYNACLDMIYQFDNLINEKIEKMQGAVDDEMTDGSGNKYLMLDDAITILKD